jgi:hypothetical protein
MRRLLELYKHKDFTILNNDNGEISYSTESWEDIAISESVKDGEFVSCERLNNNVYTI